MTKLVIFDLDGTLLDTTDDIAAAVNHALTQLNYPIHSRTTIKSFVGNGINKLIERALPNEAKTEEKVLYIRNELFIPYYNAHGAEQTKPFEGIVDLLIELQQRGIKIAVASNKYQEATLHLVENYFTNINFSAVYGQREGIAVKPDPTIVMDILRDSDVDKSETLYVGDSIVDMQTAKNSDIRAIGVTWGCKTRYELEEYAPFAVIDTANEILNLID